MTGETTSQGTSGASRRYGSSVDLFSRGLTAIIIFTMIAGILLFGFMPRLNQILTGLFVAFCVIVVTTAYSFQPIAYGMNRDGLTIYFRWRSLKIPWSSVRSIELEPKTKSYKSIRVFGSAGVLGYLGRYWSPALGFHMRLVTNRSHVVVLHRRTPYCLSPDDPDRFVREAVAYVTAEGGDERADGPAAEVRPRMRKVRSESDPGQPES